MKDLQETISQQIVAGIAATSVDDNKKVFDDCVSPVTGIHGHAAPLLFFQPREPLLFSDCSNKRIHGNIQSFFRAFHRYLKNSRCIFAVLPQRLNVGEDSYAATFIISFRIEKNAQ